MPKTDEVMVKNKRAEATRTLAQLEDCRTRLQSVELLLASSPRDALVLARALLDDVVAMLATAHLAQDARAAVNVDAVLRALPDAERRHLTVARRWLEEAEPTAASAAEGVAALRRVVADAARAARRTEVTGVAAFLRAFRRATWVHAAIAAGVVLVILVALMQTRGAQDRRSAEFESTFSEAIARLQAGDHPGAVERWRKAIDTTPGKDRTADAWNNMGWSLQQLGRYEEAIDAYRKALQLRPAFPLARNNLDAVQRKLDLKKSGKEPPPAPR